MEVSSGLVAGSHNRNEIIIIRSNGESDKKPFEDSNGKLCQICGDDVGVSAEREVFVACNECAFPICRTCYEYERREGNQVCPQCKTRFKRIKGCARVEGDEEEDEVDDLDNEFDFHEQSKRDTHRPQAADSDISLLPNCRLADEIHPEECASFPPLAVHPRPMDPSKDLAVYGYGSIAWKERMESWKRRQNKIQMMNNDDGWKNLDHDEDDPDVPLMDEARQPLSRKLPIPSSQINPYRMIIVIRLVVMGFFFHYRVTHPVRDAYILWLISVICEIWFAISWILDQFPKWLPIDRETYPYRLSLRYEKEGQPCQLSAIDIFVSTVDPSKEPPLVTANTLLSILAVDYPADKLSCYVSDDGAAMLTFETLSETAEFARKWIPFCKKFKIEPRAPERYFAQKVDYFSDKVLPSFVKERRAMKREYEEFKVRINSLVAKSKKVPDEGWTTPDGTLWPGNNGRDHPGMIQIFLGQTGGYDADGNELPCMVYISREKRPGFNHNKKAGAMNCLVRVSGVLTNAPYVLNLDCDHYINSSKALREAMCFMMDPLVGKRVCYIQFPPWNRNAVFSDINTKGLDGIQGPMYVGTGCVFRRQALYGCDAPKQKKSPAKTCNCWLKWCCLGSCFSAKPHKRKNTKPKAEGTKNISRNEDLEELLACSSDSTQESIDGKLAKKFGQSPVFAASTLGELKRTSPGSLLKEAIHVISCGYEDKTEWGNEVGWIYGSDTADKLTGLKMHCRGWRSIYCAPERPAFKGSALIDLSDRLHQVLRSAVGSIEIFFSKHCPVWYGYGGGLKPLERLSYINATVYPWTCIPLLAYCTLPAMCLLTGKFIVPELGYVAGLWFISLFMCIFATSLLEMKWGGVGIGEWWRNEQFWVIDGVSAHLFAVCQGLLKVIAGVETSKTGDGEEFSEFYAFKWRILLLPPATLLVINLIGVVFGVSSVINNGFESWGSLLGKLFFALWVIVHLYPLFKGVLGGQNRTPTIILLWSVLLASLFSILWVRIGPFSAKTDAPFLDECGVDCV